MLRVSPIAPRGTSPYSTLAADSLPAATEPMPIPMPIAASGNPVIHSSSPSVFVAWLKTGAGIRLAIDQTKTWPQIASRRIRSERTADQASVRVSTSPPSPRAAGTRGTPSAAISPTAEIAVSIRPPSQVAVAGEGDDDSAPRPCRRSSPGCVHISMSPLPGRELLVGQDLGEDSVLGRTEQGGLHAQESQDHDRPRCPRPDSRPERRSRPS